MGIEELEKICRLIRYDIVTSTTKAGSGHPTSSLSAVELMATLFFGGFLRYDLKNPENLSNDRVIFSKGHASPLLYSLYHAAGAISERDLMSLRQFGSELEGHPNPRFRFVDVASGSLGQGLSVAVGMALGIKKHVGPTSSIAHRTRADSSLKGVMSKLEDVAEIRNPKLDRLPTLWVLLGDSEMSEGQVWEAIQLASYYKLNNIVAIIDVNRLGQSRETMIGWKLQTYEKRLRAFGWNTIVVGDGHDINQVVTAYEKASRDVQNLSVPTIIIAKTIKGKGVSFLEDKEDVHGKSIPVEKLDQALLDIGEVDKNIRGEVTKPPSIISSLDSSTHKSIMPVYFKGQIVSTRQAYGDMLCYIGDRDPNLVVFDAEVSNSTLSGKFKEKFFERFYEMFIAEQNMASSAVGISKIGFVPFMSTFASFLTRCFDQLRMAQYSQANLKVVGSHAGVSIGSDGPSQMGVEDIAMMRTISNSTIFYPADATATIKLVELMHQYDGISYLRTTRGATKVIYDEHEDFKIGGSKVLKESSSDRAVIFAAGITVHEALKAQEKLFNDQINVAVVDLYSIKPLDEKTINHFAEKTKNLIVVEDHNAEGGIGEAVRSVLKNSAVKFTHFALHRIPTSGTTEELLHYEQIDAEAIIKAVKKS